MKVVVCGGRYFNNQAYLITKLDKLHEKHKFTELMQGGARGADAMAREWAGSKKGILRWYCMAEWKKYGNAAGPIRNSRMLEWKPDLVVAFPDPKSTGTWDMVEKAKAAGVETVVYDAYTS